jgi:hypothetical protein
VKLCKWEKSPSPQRNLTGDVVKGRGASYVKYELYRTHLAAAVEIEDGCPRSSPI